MHQELSTRLTPVYRWVIPTLLSIGAVLSVWFLAIENVAGIARGWAIVAGVSLAAAMVLIARILDRAKRVWLLDDRILVSDFQHGTEIPVHDIAAVGSTPWFRPRRIVIALKQPCIFGSRIMFFPKRTLRDKAAQLLTTGAESA